MSKRMSRQHNGVTFKNHTIELRYKNVDYFVQDGKASRMDKEADDIVLDIDDDFTFQEAADALLRALGIYYD